jgi:hypothetical protein
MSINETSALDAEIASWSIFEGEKARLRAASIADQRTAVEAAVGPLRERAERAEESFGTLTKANCDLVLKHAKYVKDARARWERTARQNSGLVVAVAQSELSAKNWELAAGEATRQNFARMEQVTRLEAELTAARLDRDRLAKRVEEPCLGTLTSDECRIAHEKWCRGAEATDNAALWKGLLTAIRDKAKAQKGKQA